MYAVTGITGQVGGTVAQTLLAAGEMSAPWCATKQKVGPGPTKAVRCYREHRRCWTH